METFGKICAGLLAVAALGAGAGLEAKAAGTKRICGKYSSFDLAPGETVGSFGAGHSSLSMVVSGPKGDWFFYETMADRQPAAELGTRIYQSASVWAYRRPYDPRVYVLTPAGAPRANGKTVQVSVSGLDISREGRQPFANPAIVGKDSDLGVLKRVYPGKMERCSMRWQSGTGLVSA